MKKFTDKEYESYLKELISSVFKILPLYEDKNEYLKQYITSVINYDIQGSYELIQDFKYCQWYNKTLTTLNGLKKTVELSDTTHAEVRAEVFKITNLLSQTIKELGV